MQFAVQILLARRRLLPQWQIVVPQRNYWRLHWNDREGASVITTSGPTALTPEQIVLIAPRTSFTPSLHHTVQHLYVHFQLAAPFDFTAPGVYPVPVTERYAEDLEAACVALKQEERHRTLVLTRLISGVCLALPESVWQAPIVDSRFAAVIEAMDQHRGKPLSNAQLAEITHMAPTAFVRRFGQLFGVSPQAYYLQKRLELACHMLEFEQCTIDQVAEASGFCDRNYFSSVFSNKLKVSPAAFRKQCHGG